MSSSSRSSSIASDESGLQLDPSTLLLLDNFLAEKANAESLFHELEDQAFVEAKDRKRLSVDEFRKAFAEDWQLSQFWYTSSYAHRLAEAVHDVLPSPTKDANIAFLCCPTAYVASQYLHQPSDTLLFEFDKRFAIAEGAGRFIHYDLQADEEMPEDLKGTVELAIVDPPFLNEVTNRHVAHTLKQLLHPTKGKLVLMTSTSVTCLSEVYSEVKQIGPLRMTSLMPEHTGLRNDFACWASWDGGESFGAVQNRGT